MPMSEKIYISYSRKDANQVQAIVRALELNRHQVFLDIQDIRPGDNWIAALRQAIDSSDILILVMSKNSLGSPVVIDELHYAINANKRIIPIVIDDVPAEKIPLGLQNIQWLDMRHGLDHVAERLRALLGTGDTSVEPAQPKSKGYVFLSYAKEDGEFVQTLRAFLKDEGYAYWDYEESDRDYHNQLFLELENAIMEAAAVFAIISEDWKKSKWTVREFFFAEEARRPVFLLRARAVGPTLAIAGIPYIDFVGDATLGFSKLERELSRKGL
jgi:hypothetical protein